jgi:hypothetical protein
LITETRVTKGYQSAVAINATDKPAGMLREETDNERVDYRTAKADGRAINNHRKACDICELHARETDANR